MRFWKFEYDGEEQLRGCVDNNSLPPEKKFPGLENTYSYPATTIKPGDGVILAQLEGVEANIFAVGEVQSLHPHVVHWAVVNVTVHPNPQGGLQNWRKKSSFEIKPNPAKRYGLGGLIEKHVNAPTIEHYENDSEKAVEGYLQDSRILRSSRNATLARRKKEIDKFTCQACGFQLKVGDNWVVEVHHLNPLYATDQVVTTMEDLVCLCPTCHRIAHLRKPPYSVNEIRGLRSSSENSA